MRLSVRQKRLTGAPKWASQPQPGPQLASPPLNGPQSPGEAEVRTSRPGSTVMGGAGGDKNRGGGEGGTVPFAVSQITLGLYQIHLGLSTGFEPFIAFCRPHGGGGAEGRPSDCFSTRRSGSVRVHARRRHHAATLHS